MTIQHLADALGTTDQGIDILTGPGGAIVSPTKVGYIICTTDRAGLERKFDLKVRPKSKPGVVLCGSLEQLRQLAYLNEEIDALYEDCWNKDILLGCILPWQEEAAEKFLPNDGSSDLVQDHRGTTCFVIKFGTPSEYIASELWDKQKRLVFASSANPSGKGNRGRLDGVGNRILEGVDLIIEGDDYVRSQQPDADETTRYAQGVMVEFVSKEGTLPLDEKSGKLTAPPKIIRKGLVLGEIMLVLSDHFDSFDYRHGSHH